MRLLSAYRPAPGRHDQLLDETGEVRPIWAGFLDNLAALSADERADRLAIADRYIAQSGLVHRVYNDADAAERKWPISHMPVMVSPEEWAFLEKAVIQRAELLERLLADIYGPGRLFQEGLLPTSAVVGSGDFLRPVHGAEPRGKRFLRIYAADIGRGPDGRWWVLSDRTQAPSGLGYAVENRIAVTRAFSEGYNAHQINRLAGFFSELRASLQYLNRGADARVALLTPGPYSETFAEQVFLARYLGMLLVEGGDLTVRGHKVFVRTVSGLKRIKVLLRRLDSDFCDPLELNTHSQLGIPGLVGAVREQKVTIANALGSGALEARSLMSFFPNLARHLLGEELKIPNVATWWCGQPAERRHVLENLDSLSIAPAFGSTFAELPFDASTPIAQLAPGDRARLIEAIERRGMDFVGQELVELSKTPVLEGQQLKPKPYLLRLFVTATEDGWRVMPGAFARISDQDDARYVTMRDGGRSADVWVHSKDPVHSPSLLPAADFATQRLRGLLPSRSADNMFWLGRYIERIDATARLVRALANRLLGASGDQAHVAPDLVRLLTEAGAIDPGAPGFGPATAALTAMCRTDLAGALPALVLSTRNAASVIRDRLSPDAWITLTRLSELAERPAASIAPETEALRRAEEALSLIAAFSGYAQENMSRLIGWHFLEIGRRIERASALCRWSYQLAPPSPHADGLDALLELGDCQITFRFRYQVEPGRRSVLDLMVLDRDNPRSVAFQLETIVRHLKRLPKEAYERRLTDCQRTAVTLLAEVETTTVETADEALLPSLIPRLRLLSDQISNMYFTHLHDQRSTATNLD